MQIPMQITIRDVPPSEALETHIREKAAKLDEFADHIMSCRVVVEMPHKHHQQGRQYKVLIDIKVPGHELVVNRDHNQDVYVALRDAFDAAKRELEDYVRRVRRETKLHQPELVGRVLRLFRDDRIGFIAGPDGTEYYFSVMDVVSPRFDLIREGDEVKFIAETAAEGPQARRVSVGHHHVPE